MAGWDTRDLCAASLATSFLCVMCLEKQRLTPMPPMASWPWPLWEVGQALPVLRSSSSPLFYIKIISQFLFLPLKMLSFF